MNSTLECNFPHHVGKSHVIEKVQHKKYKIQSLTQSY